MQTFGVVDRFADRIDHLTLRTTAAQRRVAVGTGSMPVIYISLAYAAVLAAISVLALIGYSNLAALGAIVLLMLRSLSYGQQLASASASLASSLPFLDRVGQTVERYEDSPAERGGTVEVGSFPKNGYGLYDMAGNVFEWVADRYGVDYYRSSPYSNPKGPDTGRFRVIRGGSWHSGTYCNRVCYRNALPSNWIDMAVGFRCAKDAD